MISSSLLCVLVCYVAVAVVALKSWTPRTNVNDKRNWNILDVPRNCDHVDFEVSSSLSLLWSLPELLVSGLTLPESGTVMFIDNMSIQLKDRKNCQGARDIKFNRNDWKGWLDPQNWQSHSDEMWLPHAERIPCIDEDVKFPAGSSFAVQLPSIMVPIGKVFYNDEEYDGDDWADFLNSDQGISQFSRQQVKQNPWVYDMGCPGKKKCICGSSAYVFQDWNYKFVEISLLHEAVCMYARNTCKNAICYSPVVPEGHCCGVCGAVIAVRDHSPDDRMLNMIVEKVKQLKTTFGESVNFHVGRTIDGHVEVAVLSESPDHVNDALALGTLVKDRLIAERFDILSADFSGLTLSSYFFNSTTGVVFGTLFIALIFFTSIYFIYVILPEKKFVNATCEHAFRFTRFKNVLHEIGSEENLEIGAEATEPQPLRFSNSTFSDRAESGLSNESHEEADEHEPGRQEYDNPTYHEMEKTMEFTSFDVKSEDEDDEKVEEFGEVEL